LRIVKQWNGMTLDGSDQIVYEKTIVHSPSRSRLVCVSAPRSIFFFPSTHTDKHESKANPEGYSTCAAGMNRVAGSVPAASNLALIGGSFRKAQIALQRCDMRKRSKPLRPRLPLPKPLPSMLSAPSTRAPKNDRKIEMRIRAR
jgi:hypothetical protein